MKQLLFIVCLIMHTSCFAQPNSKAGAKKGKPQLFIDSTTVQKLERIKDSVFNPIPYQDSARKNEEISRGINNLVELTKERDAKQRKAAIVRISIGLGLLVLLVIGLMRRKRRKTDQIHE